MVMRNLLLIALSTLAAAADGSGYVQADDGKRPILGVEMTPVPTHVLDREGLAPNQGVLVQQVYTGTAASEMGIRRDDVILSVNDAPITSMTDLRNEVGLNQVGDPVAVTVLRDGQVVQLSSGLKPWPEQIPYTPLDAAAERRFREYQDRRNNRMAKEAQDLRREIADVRRQLADEPAETSSQGAGGQPGAMPGMPAFRLTLLVPAAGVVPEVEADPMPEPEPDPSDPLANPTGDGRPWTATVVVAL